MTKEPMILNRKNANTGVDDDGLTTDGDDLDEWEDELKEEGEKGGEADGWGDTETAGEDDGNY